jgi:hypothetical protein
LRGRGERSRHHSGFAFAIGNVGAQEAKPEKSKALEEGPMQIGGSSPVGGTDMVQT